MIFLFFVFYVWGLILDIPSSLDPFFVQTFVKDL